jgi:cell division protein FtsL
MLNRVTMIYLTVIFISFCSLVTVKYYTHNLKDEVSSLNKVKSEERNQIKVLKAEWAYLNQADRLKYLATKYLALNEAKTSRIVVLGQKSTGNLHLATSENKPIEAVFQRKANWRYKSRDKILIRNKSKHLKVNQENAEQKTEAK